ncbi:hypothetical protein [Taylorella equigenitalis]|uniref:hypothetical protein n=1 Tax=Taylorella equigenitalis TaxID=29575 RepID=UPI001CEF8CC2|nr:hypothetical protein [Taylorella equigenitalis]
MGFLMGNEMCVTTKRDRELKALILGKDLFFSSSQLIDLKMLYFDSMIDKVAGEHSIYFLHKIGGEFFISHFDMDSRCINFIAYLNDLEEFRNVLLEHLLEGNKCEKSDETKIKTLGQYSLLTTNHLNRVPPKYKGSVYLFCNPYYEELMVLTLDRQIPYCFKPLDKGLPEGILEFEKFKYALKFIKDNKLWERYKECIIVSAEKPFIFSKEDTEHDLITITSPFGEVFCKERWKWN